MDYEKKWWREATEEIDRLKAELADTTWQDHADAWQKRALKAEAELALCKEAEEGSHKNALYWNEIAEKAEAERDALKADAERYRFLRKFAGAIEAVDLPDPESPDDLDKIIDAALKEKP